MLKKAIEGMRVDYATFSFPETFELDTAGPGPGTLVVYKPRRDELLKEKLKFVQTPAPEDVQHRIVILENIMN